ncbi:hypothetical protein D3261_03220 [Halococcus sp. IIIV-5B]|nr:hypothetical protein D3261_03220 [Halococcus sp. IIIV-5B]
MFQKEYLFDSRIININISVSTEILISMHERHLTQRVQVDVVALRFFTPSVTHHQQIITD